MSNTPYPQDAFVALPENDQLALQNAHEDEAREMDTVINTVREKTKRLAMLHSAFLVQVSNSEYILNEEDLKTWSALSADEIARFIIAYIDKRTAEFPSPHAAEDDRVARWRSRWVHAEFNIDNFTQERGRISNKIFLELQEVFASLYRKIASMRWLSNGYAELALLNMENMSMHFNFSSGVYRYHSIDGTVTLNLHDIFKKALPE